MIPSPYADKQEILQYLYSNLANTFWGANYTLEIGGERVNSDKIMWTLKKDLAPMLKSISSGSAMEKDIERVWKSIKTFFSICNNVHPTIAEFLMDLTQITQDQLTRLEIKRALISKLPADLQSEVLAAFESVLNPWN